MDEKEVERKKKIAEDLSKFAKTRGGEFEKPKLVTPEPAPKPKTEEPVKKEEPKKVEEEKCPKGFTYTVGGDGREACRMPFSYHSGHGHMEQCEGCVYSYGRWFETCEPNFVRNGCCLCTPRCPNGMPMASWPHKDLSDYVCLIPVREQTASSPKAAKKTVEPKKEEPKAEKPKKDEPKGLDL